MQKALSILHLNQKFDTRIIVLLIMHDVWGMNEWVFSLKEIFSKMEQLRHSRTRGHIDKNLCEILYMKYIFLGTHDFITVKGNSLCLHLVFHSVLYAHFIKCTSLLTFFITGKFHNFPNYFFLVAILHAQFHDENKTLTSCSNLRAHKICYNAMHIKNMLGFEFFCVIFFSTHLNIQSCVCIFMLDV